MKETAFDPRRRLCPDGSCVGVLDADGRCSVCGRPPGAATSGAASDGELGPTAEAEPGASVAAVEPAGGFDPARRLCDDGSCVGVVGTEGLCGTCGRRAE